MNWLGSSFYQYGVALALALTLAPAVASAQGAGLGAAGELVDPEILRVCADPSNMPFSDMDGQGFENRLAELMAEKLGRKQVRYFWFPTVMGFVRNTLGANRCDVIMGYAQGDELVQNTNAYYRSAYVLVYKRDSGLDGVTTISDPRLAGKRVGVVQGTPPASHLAAAKLMSKAKVYPLMVDTRAVPSVAKSMIDDLVDEKIDAAAIWGAMAGYYVHEAGTDLSMIPLVREKAGARLAYRITMGVRPSDQEWKRTLNGFIRDNQEEINELLQSYHVPLFDEQDQPIR
ncbi:substrate-binding domain-containing protein [Mesorhizobium xinjiangense]|uniref:substrate-binding domain-containing protein n=1 Tax=Mesorhizobium xinjiangense TaxID=2678685 RepID=UPI0012ECCF3A|nr:substrate-binding domain-containing protein [Mesorhizobium xinjiangense]